jgi:ABC-type transporter Mla subunit MlaD
VQTIEDELKATIGQALGRQGRKLLTALQGMQREWQHYQELCQAIDACNSAASTATSTLSTNREQLSSTSTKQPPTETNNDLLVFAQLNQSIERYNALRQAALTARWELLVQRQAAGFVVNNHAHVTQHYPIPAALPTLSKENFKNGTKSTHASSLLANAQGPPPEAPPPPGAQKALDWWQRVGRWK